MADKKRIIVPNMLMLICLSLFWSGNTEGMYAESASPHVTQGSLFQLDRDGLPVGECPLKHTSVKTDVSGFLARVTVTQDFENRTGEKIEAVYTFPLPQRAAVDEMDMDVGGRIVRGVIRHREEARRIFEEARRRGNVAALLDQERPNIFTQSVTNIVPGANVRITISYLVLLGYENCVYEFVFPMVVGPRYIPGHPTGRQSGGWAPDTDQVPDASRITPLVTPPGSRAGHDIDIEVRLDAGIPINSIYSVSHEVITERINSRQAVIRLRDQATLPNKDFILRYDVARGTIQDSLFVHRSSRGGFFTLMLQPPDRPEIEDITPKELVFVLDTSGSMSGFPLEKAKETMRLALAGLYPQDTFNLITFAGDTKILFPAPVPATPENLRAAYSFMASRTGGGGTEMMKAIRAALDTSDDTGRVRIVCFMTDGYVGNDLAIVDEVRRHRGARVFSFGIGNSVNRFLLDTMAREGRGEVEYVTLHEDGSAAARRFHKRVRQPVLTDIQLDFGGLPVSDIHPSRLPDLFAARPLMITGRFNAPARGVLRLRGRQGSHSFERTIPVDFPANQPEHSALASLWARECIEDLSAQDMAGLQSGSMRSDLREEITRLGLEFRLMTPFTSFIAVEEKIITDGGHPRRVEVAVEMPDGVSYEGVFGGVAREAGKRMIAAAPASAVANAVVGGTVGRSVSPSKSSREEASRPSWADRQTHGDTPAELAQEIRSRLDPQVQTWIENARTGRQTGSVEVEILLADASQAVRDRILKLGFKVTKPSAEARRLVGRIAVEKLEILARFNEILFLSPGTDDAN
jgi:Ca-activated chloride channel family protein